MDPCGTPLLMECGDDVDAPTATWKERPLRKCRIQVRVVPVMPIHASLNSIPSCGAESNAPFRSMKRDSMI